ncbi:uncharacterized protein LOC130137911 [Syzygium oleosum]|uniref:uncharacterized protein LOC130137911 n=1 Tax=Syzygium oleosum TaxID=219896 RepID=UPI0024BABAC8|nr:uncharacterized protein LOC130137911 [Syzygium oleosum]
MSSFNQQLWIWEVPSKDKIVSCFPDFPEDYRDYLYTSTGTSQTSLIHLQRRSKCFGVSTCARHIGHSGSVVLKELAIQSIWTRGLRDSKLESCLFNLIHRYFLKQPKVSFLLHTTRAMLKNWVKLSMSN